MFTRADLENALDAMDFGKTEKILTKGCKDTFGYKQTKSCTCETRPSESSVKELKERVREYCERFHRSYPFRERDKLYIERTRCLHYSGQNGGVVFTLESHKELPYGIKLGMKEAHMRGRMLGMGLKRQGGGLIDILKGSRKLQKNVTAKYQAHKDLTIRSCYVYGNSFDKLKGKDERTDFECHENKSLGERLRIPTIVRNINVDQILEEILKS